jgi:hypothetical protein
MLDLRVMLADSWSVNRIFRNKQKTIKIMTEIKKGKRRKRTDEYFSAW